MFVCVSCICVCHVFVCVYGCLSLSENWLWDIWKSPNHCICVLFSRIKIYFGKIPLSAETDSKGRLLIWWGCHPHKNFYISTQGKLCRNPKLSIKWEDVLWYEFCSAGCKAAVKDKNLQEIMTNPSVLFNLPELLNIIGDADNEIFEDNLLLINDAYQVTIKIL